MIESYDVYVAIPPLYMRSTGQRISLIAVHALACANRNKA